MGHFKSQITLCVFQQILAPAGVGGFGVRPVIYVVCLGMLKIPCLYMLAYDNYQTGDRFLWDSSDKWCEPRDVNASTSRDVIIIWISNWVLNPGPHNKS